MLSSLGTSEGLQRKQLTVPAETRGLRQRWVTGMSSSAPTICFARGRITTEAPGNRVETTVYLIFVSTPEDAEHEYYLFWGERGFREPPSEIRSSSRAGNMTLVPYLSAVSVGRCQMPEEKKRVKVWGTDQWENERKGEWKKM